MDFYEVLRLLAEAKISRFNSVDYRLPEIILAEAKRSYDT